MSGGQRLHGIKLKGAKVQLFATSSASLRLVLVGGSGHSSGGGMAEGIRSNLAAASRNIHSRTATADGNRGTATVRPNICFSMNSSPAVRDPAVPVHCYFSHSLLVPITLCCMMITATVPIFTVPDLITMSDSVSVAANGRFTPAWWCLPSLNIV